jgi:hypothetical protein
MRSLTTFFGSALCAFALLAAPVQAKDKSAGAPPAATCKCTADTCKCEKKGKCKCPEASCTCEKCKALRDGKPATTTPAPAAPTTPAKQILELNNDVQDHCGKCDKKDGDKEKPATCPTCPSKDPAPAKESINLDNHCGKCDKKDDDKEKPDDDKEKPAVCPNCPKPKTK